ncbi:UvrD-helicase domain-containing protein [Pseudomarimonas salicorniae]|uniref:ATP-dependent DNA helicase Rep n=1 Tax=Pseudomarimonas salicorniae TaxID=2933270 RepID=A0ABT0GIP7_9GAMM|nr:UvrD-helicase domain-containing protein [Lysobacter sp. CAU 1642]MCK7594429.1 UvrD-helicase domain-containing protein [Lysobacter sp. CAU 1642]
MSQLNPPQAQAVHYTVGPLLVLAGAGSGKTKVITEKIAHLIADRGLAPAKIAAITFTNKAAKEMRERIGKRLRADRTEGLNICTFHSLGLRFLQIEHAAAGLRRGFSIFDSDDSAGLLKELLPKGAKPDAVDALRGLISRAKNDGLSPEQAAERAASPREHEAAEAYAEYQRRLAAFNAVDFDDLIRLPVALLEADAERAAAWRERLRYLLVDEYQDTNLTQYRLLTLLAGPRGAFTCVGDDDQSIYAWRGANPENLDQLGKDYPNLKVIPLEQNYRCTRRILRAANTLIANNPHLHVKKLWSEHAEGEPIRVWECRDAEHEAERVAAEISFLQQTRKFAWSDFAVLFRGNFQSRAIEKALQLLKIPYHLSGGTAYLDRGEVKDLLAWLRVLANPDDDAAFLRAIGAPKRDVGTATLARLAELARHAGLPMSRAAGRIDLLKQLPARAASGLSEFATLVEQLRDHARGSEPAEVCRQTLERSGLLAALRAQCKDESGFQRRRANLDELSSWLEGAKGSGLDGLANQLTLLGHADRGEAGEAVRLMSLHASKGLEFRCVFVVGCEEGVLPHEASMEEGRLDEERRLMYVAITRAREQLVLSHSRQARKWGEVHRLEPSRFLSELPAEDLLRDGEDPALHAEVKQERTRARMGAIAALLGD